MAKVFLFESGEEKRVSKVTVQDVAMYFLTRVYSEEEFGSVITHLKLQKLCYYAQAWHMVFADKPMFDERFEAWAHGPVSPDLWQSYKGSGWQPIPAPLNFDVTVFDSKQLETLDEVWDAYAKFDPKYIERLTHQEEPWINARGNCPKGDFCDREITTDAMKDYYSKIQANGQ